MSLCVNINKSFRKNCIDIVHVIFVKIVPNILHVICRNLSQVICRDVSNILHVICRQHPKSFVRHCVKYSCKNKQRHHLFSFCIISTVPGVFPSAVPDIFPDVSSFGNNCVNLLDA